MIDAGRDQGQGDPVSQTKPTQQKVLKFRHRGIRYPKGAAIRNEPAGRAQVRGRRSNGSLANGSVDRQGWKKIKAGGGFYKTPRIG